MSFIAVAIAVAAANPVAADSIPVLMLDEPGEGFASTALAAGRNKEAIEALERSLAKNADDPALLINLGIAYAHRGDEERAKLLFKAAMASKHPADLETASGATLDSRMLARRALSMLDRGEFSVRTRSAGALTLRD